MRLKVTRSKNAASLYVIKSVYDPVTQSNSSKIVEKLGTEKELREKLGGQDPYEWARKYIQDLNKQEKEEQRQIMVSYSQSKRLKKNVQQSFNGGYLFLQALYHQLGLHRICREISEQYKFTFDLNSILSRLLYARIIYPASKLGTLGLAKKFLEQPNFELQHIYRALEVIAKETDFIQSQLYQNSLLVSKRNDRILYYDCTNYFFETEEAEGLKQYGVSKEHRPNPLVEMGLFMDGDGIPLAFSIHSGNINEQTTLKPLEKKILQDFKLARFVVCTDAGLSSTENRKFNNLGSRAFITTQSVKKLKAHLKEWALDPDGWFLPGDKTHTFYNIEKLEATPENAAKYRDAIFYKERWINEDGLEQKLIITFSLKYRDYQFRIRAAQIHRAEKLVSERPNDLNKRNQNDCKRFIKTTGITEDGELADRNIHSIDQSAITEEEQYDGFYAVCTNLEDDAPEITGICRRRWEIEECFRIMKTDFKARPVYLKRDDRIRAHFTTCFLALVLYRFLEQRLQEQYTSNEIIQGLKDMNFYSVPGEGYIPTYTRTDLTDALHDAFGFHTDYQIITQKQMKKIFRSTKK